MKKSVYVRFSVHTLREILPLIASSRDSGFYYLHGRLVGVSSIRLRTYTHDCTTCHHCGLEATHFAVERQKNDPGFHLNIYGLNDNGHEVMFTSDHIVPKSRGGSKSSLENRQCLCTKCNQRKSNKTEEELCLTSTLIAC